LGGFEKQAEDPLFHEKINEEDEKDIVAKKM
jgi:hypothetical protein